MKRYDLVVMVATVTLYFLTTPCMGDITLRVHLTGQLIQNSPRVDAKPTTVYLTAHRLRFDGDASTDGDKDPEIVTSLVDTTKNTSILAFSSSKTYYLSTYSKWLAHGIPSSSLKILSTGERIELLGHSCFIT